MFLLRTVLRMYLFSFPHSSKLKIQLTLETRLVLVAPTPSTLMWKSTYNFTLRPLYLWFSTCSIYLLKEKKSIYKWTHAVQTYFVQGVNVPAHFVRLCLDCYKPWLIEELTFKISQFNQYSPKFLFNGYITFHHWDECDIAHHSSPDKHSCISILSSTLTLL